VLFSWLIKELDRVAKDEAGHTDPDTTKMVHERKQSMVLLLKIVKIRRLMHIPVLFFFANHAHSCSYSTISINRSLSSFADQGIELFCCS
jgi:hypothetical protein